jgi:hypothetical protein
MSGIELPPAPSLPVRLLLSVDVDDLLIGNADFFEEVTGPDYRSEIDSEVQTSLRILK